MKHHHLLVLGLAILMGVSYYLGYTPIALSLVFLLASAVAYYLYAKDKAAAVRGSSRVAENSLHLVALAGGWPGALIAQQRLRHKTKKRRFRGIFWIIMLLNISGLIWLHTAQGNRQLRHGTQQLENMLVVSLPSGPAMATVLFLTTFRT